MAPSVVAKRGDIFTLQEEVTSLYLTDNSTTGYIHIPVQKGACSS
jgi:hypothetical protein